MQTRSFCEAATQFVITEVTDKGWPRHRVEPLVRAFLAQIETVIICFPVEPVVEHIHNTLAGRLHG